jgi:RNA-directed DNA polymerase
MMHGHEKSDSVIVAVKPANKAEQPAADRTAANPTAAEPVERRTRTKGNADWQSTRRTQGRVSVSQALERIRQTRGGRSYGAGGGGYGTFIVHTNRWRLPRGPSQ